MGLTVVLWPIASVTTAFILILLLSFDHELPEAHAHGARDRDIEGRTLLSVSEEDLNAESMNDDHLITLFGWINVVIFGMLLSGKIPTPLYTKAKAANTPSLPKAIPSMPSDTEKLRGVEQMIQWSTGDTEVWPKGYRVLQYTVIGGALAQLHIYASKKLLSPAEENVHSFAGLMDHVRLLSIFEPLRLVVYLLFCVAMIEIAKRSDKSSRLVTTGPLWTVICRNLGLYAATLLIDCLLTSFIDCGGLIWSGIPVGDQVYELIEKWHLYHQPEFLMVRISHSLTYLPVLMCLTRRSYMSFVKWRIFMLFIPDAVADIAHYVDAPSIASLRLDYESGPLCAGVDRHFIRTSVSFPMNWIFLTTNYGDPSH